MLLRYFRMLVIKMLFSCGDDLDLFYLNKNASCHINQWISCHVFPKVEQRNVFVKKSVSNWKKIFSDFAKGFGRGIWSHVMSWVVPIERMSTKNYSKSRWPPTWTDVNCIENFFKAQCSSWPHIPKFLNVSLTFFPTKAEIHTKKVMEEIEKDVHNILKWLPEGLPVRKTLLTKRVFGHPYLIEIGSSDLP